ncbi:eukaryotic translation initiation factor 3 subunit E [Pseudogymnoascus sp. 24MN13]|nr:eukaryotic translation initiation factor 3 subunit E [Pseudogymnoascus sp. 24MN13]
MSDCCCSLRYSPFLQLSQARSLNFPSLHFATLHPKKLSSWRTQSFPSTSYPTHDDLPPAKVYLNHHVKKTRKKPQSWRAPRARLRPAKTAEQISEENNLLPKLITHLDRHLIFPLLQFVAEQQEDEEDSQEITRAKYELLKTTNMTDYVASLYTEINDVAEPPKEFGAKRQAVLERLDQFEQESAAITDLLGREDVITNLRADKVANLEYLKKEHEVTREIDAVLYDFGNVQYSCGNYGAAAELLYQFRVLSTDETKVSAATWGKLASEILTTNWESAMEEVTKVKDSIDTKLFADRLAQLNRTAPPFINTIQTACPWVLRYLAAAVITNRSRTRNTGQYQKQLKDIIRIVKQETYEYSDPVTDFIKALYVDFDFEEAQRKVSDAEEVLRGDFFLVAASDAFVEAARHLISESYCKIHQRIDIKDLSARLGLDQDEGEKWIVNLIRDTRVDAKIDYKEGTVVMNHPPSSVYQQVIERTKGGFFRTQVLSAAVAK